MLILLRVAPNLLSCIWWFHPCLHRWLLPLFHHHTHIHTDAGTRKGIHHQHVQCCIIHQRLRHFPQFSPWHHTWASGAPNRFVYCATKAAVIGLTKAIAVDFADKGIRFDMVIRYCFPIVTSTIFSVAMPSVQAQWIRHLSKGELKHKLDKLWKFFVVL